MKMEIMKLGFMLCFLFVHAIVQGATFNVMDHGAKADEKTDDAKAFEDTWNAACGSSGSATIAIPQGKYLLGPLTFTGPCKNVASMMIKMDGYLMGVTDLNKYPTGDWIFFSGVDGLTISGGGTFDGQGGAIWHLNDCQKNPNCKLLPTNLKFIGMTNLVLNGFTSLNSKNFHFGIVGCTNVKASNLKIIAPGDSVNTDGMHIERCTGVTIQNTKIGTGDDCISLGQGLTNVFISQVICGPGHGISVGSLGKYPDEKDVTGIIVTDSTIIGTLNGIRIKSWPNSPTASTVSNITFQNIDMNNVANPIIIDQLYCPSGSCPNTSPSRVAISDVTFKNVKGSYTSDMGVTLHCSQGFPCQNVKLEEINLQYQGTKALTTPKAECLNVKATYTGSQVPPPCA